MRKEVHAHRQYVTARERPDLLDRFRGLRYHHKFIFGFLVACGVIALWRGLWLIMDLAFFPDSPLLSGVFSVLLGLTILAATGTMLRVLTSG
jgi:hypothetical protein